MKSVLFSSLIAVSMHAADSAQLRNLDNRVSALEQRKNGGGIILPSAGANLSDDVGLCLDAEFLLWKAHQTGMNFAQGFAAATSTNPFAKPNFIFDPGVRILVGLRPNHDDWQIDASWTHFYTKASRQYDTASASLVPLFKIDDSSVDLTDAVSGVWRVNLNVIDLELGRASFLSKWLSLKPYLAIRNVWLHQKYSVTANLPASGLIEEAQMKSNLWGIGPRGGFEAKFGLGEGFYFFNNTSGSLLWGYFRNSQSNVLLTAPYDNIRRNMDVHTSTFNVDMSLGLGWDRRFDDNHYRISFRGAWEHHLFVDTNFFDSSLENSFVAFDRPNGNFTTEGFTFAMRFDF